MFKYGFEGVADGQLRSLAAISTMATQSISTTQSSIVGWNGDKFTNEESTTLFMVSKYIAIIDIGGTATVSGASL